MQVKNKVLAGRWRQTKKGAGAAYKKMLRVKIFQPLLLPPVQKKIMVNPLRQKCLKKYDHFRIQKLEVS